MRRVGCLAVRTSHLLFSAVVIATAMSPARAQDYPARPVEMIVPFAAGGGSELLARLLADGLAKRLGQPFVVVNRPGATILPRQRAAELDPARKRRCPAVI